MRLSPPSFIVRPYGAKTSAAHFGDAPPGGAVKYDRARDLPRLMPLWPAELTGVAISPTTANDMQKIIVERLHQALRRERRRGLAGDWCYDLARHRQLLLAYRAELRTLGVF